MKKGDIVLIPFPFSDLTGKKLRPAIILCASPQDISVCFITTQFQWKDKFDFVINPTNINGLKKSSVARISKIATLDKELVVGKLGVLEQKYIYELNQGLIQVLQLS